MKRNACFVFAIIACGLLQLASGVAFAAMEATVISARGETFAKRDGADWAGLKRGDKIAEGNVVKTGSKSFVRLLSPSGNMIKVPAETEIRIDFSSAKKSGSKKGGKSLFLSELLSEGVRTRINAVRGFDPVKVDEFQGDWIAFNKLSNCTPENLEAALELAAAFQEKKAINRSVFITWKLAGMLPENQGVKALSEKMLQAYENRGKWSTGDIRDGTGIKKGDRVAIRYSNPDESYVCLFRTAVTTSGKIKTTRLFPTSDLSSEYDENALYFFSRVKAAAIPVTAAKDKVRILETATSLAREVAVLKKGRTAMILDKDGRYYRIMTEDNKYGWVRVRDVRTDQAPGKHVYAPLVTVFVENEDGMLHFWGWSSPGPTTDAIVGNVVSKVENVLKKDKTAFNQNVLNGFLPPICGAVFMLNLVCG